MMAAIPAMPSFGETPSTDRPGEPIIAAPEGLCQLSVDAVLGQYIDVDIILEEGLLEEDNDEDGLVGKMFAMTSSAVGESMDSEIPDSRLPKSEVTDKDPNEHLPPPPPPPPPSNEDVMLLDGLVGFRRPRRPPR